MSNFTYHTDPGHGWLEVEVSVLEELGIKEKISSYSYMSRDKSKAYLEEDCDAGIFFKAYEAKYGSKPSYTEKHLDNSFVRNLPTYK